MRPPVVVRTAATREESLKGFGTTMAEARALVTWLALTGVTYAVAKEYTCTNENSALVAPFHFRGSALGGLGGPD